MEPQKPFACSIPECGMAFTNEDHLHVHTKKHDMMLQLGAEQKAAFVVDQTPTPTSFIKSCEDVGLFQALQDLQTVNPFDEGFKRAIECNNKSGLLVCEAADDALHTPQMFPAPVEPGATGCASQRHVTISRSSSDESGAIKEYETTTISKLTNEVTTISRVVGKPDAERHPDETLVRPEATNVDVQETVSYTNNIIKIKSNVEIRKESQNIEMGKVSDVKGVQSYLMTDKPIFTQKSIDYVVDSFTSEVKRGDSVIENENVAKILKDIQETKDDETKEDRKRKSDDVEFNDDFEVILKFPNKKYVRMKAMEEVADEDKTKVKEKLRQVIEEKNERPIEKPILVDNFAVPIAYPVNMPYRVILNNVAPIVVTPAKLPIKAVKSNIIDKIRKRNTTVHNDIGNTNKEQTKKTEEIDDHKSLLERRSAASKRYRCKLKQTMQAQAAELTQLKTVNRRLQEENTRLRSLLAQHLKTCTVADETVAVSSER